MHNLRYLPIILALTVSGCATKAPQSAEAAFVRQCVDRWFMSRGFGNGEANLRLTLQVQRECQRMAKPLARLPI